MGTGVSKSSMIVEILGIIRLPFTGSGAVYNSSNNGFINSPFC